MKYKSMQLYPLFRGVIFSSLIFFLACKKEVYSNAQPPDIDTVITSPIQADTITRTVLFENNTNGVRQFRIPALVKTTKGSLIAVCDARVNREGDMPNKISKVLRRSTNDGRTWSEMQTIVETQGNEAAGDASLLVDKITGTIWMFFIYAKEGIGTETSQPGYGDSTIHVLAMKSYDDGITWSEPIDLTRSVKDKDWRYAVASPGHGIQLKDGTLLLTAYFGQPKSITWKQSAFAFYSKDNGKTWKRTLPIAEMCNEGMAVELENGQVMVNMRNQSRKPNGGTRRAVAFNSDLTKPWTVVQYDSTLVEPTCLGSIIKLQYGEAAGKDWLVFANPAHPINRENMILRFSKDGGKQWISSLQLWPDGAMYSDMVELQNGDIGVFYEKFVPGSFYLEFARVPRQLLIK